MYGRLAEAAEKIRSEPRVGWVQRGSPAWQAWVHPSYRKGLGVKVARVDLETGGHAQEERWHTIQPVDPRMLVTDRILTPKQERMAWLLRRVKLDPDEVEALEVLWSLVRAGRMVGPGHRGWVGQGQGCVVSWRKDLTISTTVVYSEIFKWNRARADEQIVAMLRKAGWPRSHK